MSVRSLRVLGLCTLVALASGCASLSFEKEKAAQAKILASIEDTPLPAGFSIAPDAQSGLRSFPNCEINLDCTDIGASFRVSSNPLSTVEMCGAVARWAAANNVKTEEGVSAWNYLNILSAEAPFSTMTFAPMCAKVAADGDTVVLRGVLDPVDGFALEFTFAVGGSGNNTEGADPLDPAASVPWYGGYRAAEPIPAQYK